MRVVGLILFLSFCPYIVGKQLLVGRGKQFLRIKDAISISKSGDSILIYPGKYSEGNIVINKSLYIRGIGFPTLDGEKKHEILSIKSNKVWIEGLKIIRSGVATLNDPCGIKVYDSNRVTIIDNTLNDNFFGIYLQFCQNCRIRNNRIISNAIEEQQIGNGIHCWKSDSLIIEGNSISGHRDGIYFEFVTNSIIYRNISEKNIRYGLHFMFSNDDSYISNVFKFNGAGVAVMFTKRVKMIHNAFLENWGDAAYGLLLKEISDSYINSNIFRRNTVGIFMEGTSRLKLEKNSFEQNGWAMKIQASCMENKIYTSNFIGNTFDVGTNGTLVLNTFSANYWDKYEGYDLNKDQIGDIPYHPLSIFSVIIEKTPSAMLLFRSIMITLLDKSEKLLPSLTPDNFEDKKPLMHSNLL